MISRKHNFIFLHIPKTAGNSITSVLSKYAETTLQPQISPNGYETGDNFETIDPRLGNDKHFTLQKYINYFKEEIYSYRILTTVRNPWDWACSCYFFRKQVNEGIYKKENSIWKSDDSIIAPDKFDKEEFLRYLYSNSQMPQSDYLRSNKKINVYLMRYESLQNDFLKACNLLNIPSSKLPRLNATRRFNYKKIFDQELNNAISKIYFRDIEMFNYQFS